MYICCFITSPVQNLKNDRTMSRVALNIPFKEEIYFPDQSDRVQIYWLMDSCCW